MQRVRVTIAPIFTCADSPRHPARWAFAGVASLALFLGACGQDASIDVDTSHQTEQAELAEAESAPAHTGTVDCGSLETIWTNATTSARCYDVSLSPRCKDSGEGKLPTMWKAKGTSKTDVVVVENGKTKGATISLAAGEHLVVDCVGKVAEGTCCEWKLESCPSGE